MMPPPPRSTSIDTLFPYATLFRSLHQSLPRLRARLHLLLRAAEPCLARLLAGPRLRDQDRRQAGGGGAAAQGAGAQGLQARAHRAGHRSEEHTSELQSLMRISYAVFCLKKKITPNEVRYSNR